MAFLSKCICLFHISNIAIRTLNLLKGTMQLPGAECREMIFYVLDNLFFLFM